MGEKMTLGSVQTFYNTALDLAFNFFRGKSYTVATNTRVIVKRTGTDILVARTSPPLCCLGWPYRHGSGKQVDILASAEELFSLAKQCCVKSTIRVSYFDVEAADRVFAIESVHYDYECLDAVSEMHPICHVQGTSNIVEGSEYFADRRTHIDTAAIQRRCKTMRIPTAFVNLTGILAILASDHMEADEWDEFMDKMAKKCVSMPQLHKHHIPDDVSLGSGIENSICAWWWYFKRRALESR